MAFAEIISPDRYRSLDPGVGTVQLPVLAEADKGGSYVPATVCARGVKD